MKKLFSLILVFLLINVVSYAQINIGGTPISFSKTENISQVVPFKTMDFVDVAQLMSKKMKQTI